MMVSPIEDYAILSNCRTAALVSRDGSIDWLCVPRFDSPSVFGALLGQEDHGRWLIRPADADATATRHYDGNTFTLVTRWECASGAIEVTDLMTQGEGRSDIIRRITGISGEVQVTQELRIRFDYSRALPWVRQAGSAEEPAMVAMAGPNALVVRGLRLHADGSHAHHGDVTVRAGQTIDMTMTWFTSYLPVPDSVDVDNAIATTAQWWTEWASKIEHSGPYEAHVTRSLLVLRALTHAATGGIIAAATTSLPESFGGERNWDYRFVWLRDASLTLEALIAHGDTDEAQTWRRWLLRAVAGDPADVQIMYGLAGERELPERIIESLPGYGSATPVRVGNAAVDQYQGDVIGEVLVALEAARAAGLSEDEFSWQLQKALLAFVEENWQRPDNGIWEIRGEPRMFTHSRAMVWAALDRGVRAVQDFGLPGPAERWAELRDAVRREIDEHGYNRDRGHFVQAYGSVDVDAALLLLPEVGFCAADDPRMLGTVAEIERRLIRGGLVHRYRTATGVDGLSGDEHPFIACSFWLVEQYAASGRIADARALMDRLCGLANDVGLLSEEYDVDHERHAGNTPQALSHLALVRAADAITTGRATTPRGAKPAAM